MATNPTKLLVAFPLFTDALHEICGQGCLALFFHHEEHEGHEGTAKTKILVLTVT
jgi:hypothetical protein